MAVGAAVRTAVGVVHLPARRPMVNGQVDSHQTDHPQVVLRPDRRN